MCVRLPGDDVDVAGLGGRARADLAHAAQLVVQPLLVADEPDVEEHGVAFQQRHEQLRAHLFGLVGGPEPDLPARTVLDETGHVRIRVRTMSHKPWTRWLLLSGRT